MKNFIAGVLAVLFLSHAAFAGDVWAAAKPPVDVWRGANVTQVKTLPKGKDDCKCDKCGCGDYCSCGQDGCKNCYACKPKVTYWWEGPDEQGHYHLFRSDMKKSIAVDHASWNGPYTWSDTKPIPFKDDKAPKSPIDRTPPPQAQAPAEYSAPCRT